MIEKGIRFVIVAGALFFAAYWTAVSGSGFKIGHSSNQSFEIPEIFIQLSSKKLNKLRRSRFYATVTGSRTEENSQWIRARLQEGEENYKVKLRLRGLNPNHWVGAKISFLVKLRNARQLHKYWRNMRSSDLIIPWDRGWFQEALASFLNKRLGLIYADVDFVKLFLNGIYQGPYVLMDRITKENLERNDTAVSPVFRWAFPTKEVAWKGNDYPSDPRIIYNLPAWVNKLDNLPNKEQVKSVLNKVFELLTATPFDQMVYDKLSYFLDMRKIAAANAIAKIMGAHSEALHNTILYFDNSTGQFYLIVRDPLYNDRLPSRFEWGVNDKHWPIITKELLGNAGFLKLRDEQLRKLIAIENDFFSYYDQWCKTYQDVIEADPLAHDVEGIDAGGKGSFSYVRKEVRGIYKSNFSVAKSVIASYPQQETYEISTSNSVTVVQFLVKTSGPVGQSGPGVLTIRHDSKSSLHVKNIKLLVKSGQISNLWGIVGRRRSDKTSGTGELEMNFDMDDLTLPPGKDIKLPVIMPDTPDLEWQVAAIRNGIMMSSSELTAFSSWYSDHGNDFDFMDQKPETVISEKSNIAIGVSDNQLVVSPGDYYISKTITLPRGYRLHIKGGTKLTFAPGVSFISYSPVSIEGTSSLPVIFCAKDRQQGWGVFAVLQTNDGGYTNVVEGLEMSGSKGANHYGISYTAGLAFLKSDVTIRNSFFYQNGLDDAINIKKAKVHLTNCLFIDNPSDGIDGDWISGAITGNLFINQGGDAIDFSGSKDVEVTDNMVFFSKDKGFSMGERSHAAIARNLIAFNNIGIASKDCSEVQSKNNVYYGNKTDLTAYRKKPIWGGGSIKGKCEIFYHNRMTYSNDSESSIHLENSKEDYNSGPLPESPKKILETLSLISEVLHEDYHVAWQVPMRRQFEEMERWIRSKDLN